MCLVLAGAPFDLIKVKMQTMKVEPGKPAPYTGAIDCTKKIIRAEGVRQKGKGVQV